MKDITQQKQDQARIIEQQRALSILMERDRLGRELHDTQGQFPGYVKTQAQAIRLMMKRERGVDAAAQLEQLIAAAAAFVDARESITSLKGGDKRWDFFEQLPEWLNTFQKMSGISADYAGPQQRPERWIETEAEVHLLRIIQEAMTNARKHARPTRIGIDIRLGGSSVTLTIADDGSGFNTVEERPAAAGFGLAILRERASEIGGSCVISSSPKTGTIVTVQTPLAMNPGGNLP